MNFLYLASDPAPAPKGAGVRIQRTVQTLCRLGHRVRLFTASTSATADEPTPGPLHSDLCQHTTVRLPAGNFLQRMMAFRAAAAGWLGEQGEPGDSAVQFRGIWEGMAALGWARTRGAPLIFEVHGFPSVELPFHYPALDGEPGVLEKLIEEERLLLSAASLVLTHSQTGRRFLKMRGVPEERIAVVPNAVDPELFSPPPLPPVADPPLRMVYLGTAAPWQGLGLVLEALGRLRGRSDIELHAVGPRKSFWRRELRDRARRLRVHHLLHLSEPTGQPELVPVLRTAHLCLAPMPADPRNALQGACPIKVLEYMAAGRPILATRIAPLLEILEHGRNAYLVQPSSPAALAEGIAWMLANPEQREQLGRQARQDLLARFTPALFDARLAAALERLG